MKAKIVMAALVFVLAGGCDPYKEGSDMMRKGEYKDAAEYFKQLTKERPDDARAHHELGYAYSRLKMYDKAIQEYKRALELNPDYFHSRLNMGTVYLKLENYPKAIEHLEKAMELKPENVTARVNLASAYSKQLKFDEAMEQIEKAEELSRGERDFSSIKQSLQKGKDDYEAAMEWLEEQGAELVEEPGEQEGADEGGARAAAMESGDTAGAEE